MKIIKPGKVEDPTFWWEGKTFGCKKCGCQFQVERTDYHSDAPSFPVQCPTCGVSLRLVRPSSIKIDPSKPIFEEIFGDGELFENIFGKPK
jgi:hypothetical protein